MEYYVKLDAPDIIAATAGLDEARAEYLDMIIEEEIAHLMEMRRVHDGKFCSLGRTPTRDEAIALLDEKQPFGHRTPRAVCIQFADLRFAKVLELRESALAIDKQYNCPSIRLDGSLYRQYLELTETDNE